jgi:hypothetical protein
MKLHLLMLQAVLCQAAIRFGCGTVSIQRLDPLVEPGHVPSAHVSNLCMYEENDTDLIT